MRIDGTTLLGKGLPFFFKTSPEILGPSLPRKRVEIVILFNIDKCPAGVMFTNISYLKAVIFCVVGIQLPNMESPVLGLREVCEC